MIKRLFTALTLLLFCGSALFAQNTLTVPSVTIAKGKSMSLPVRMNNTADIVAVQFTLTLPDGIVLETEKSVPAERAAGHSLTLRSIGENRYMAVLFSSTNAAISGSAGKLLSLNLTASQAVEEGVELPMQLSEVIMSNTDGANLVTEYTAGNVTVALSPDFEISALRVETKEANPGENVLLKWQVANIGGLDTQAGWSEAIYLNSPDGTQKHLTTIYSDEILESGAVLTRSAEIKLPELLGIDGEATFSIKLSANNGSGEQAGADGNNSAIAASTILIGKRLGLTPALIEANEASGEKVRYYLTRSGNTSTAETFAVTATQDSRVALPSSVTVGKGESGAYFYAEITPNKTLDNNSTVNIEVDGNGYPATSAQLVIADDTKPKMTLKSNITEITEGEVLDFTIGIERPLQSDLAIELTADKKSRFKFPTSIVIPAGKTTVNVQIQSVDDSTPDIEQEVTFTVYAAEHQPALTAVILKDNDVPTLHIELTPDKVSESDGPLSVVARIKRSSNIDKSVRIKLSDNSEGNIYYGRNDFEMAAGVEEVTLNLGPIDNALNDGERTYFINAAVYIASCNCSAGEGTTDGITSAQLTVFDNDGPALSLKTDKSVLAEGGKIEVTVTRNTSTGNPLTVTLCCDNAPGIEFPSSVTIPAGETSAKFNVVSLKNDDTNDGYNATITASAAGYAKGTTWFTVSDQTLPDAQITSIEASATEAVVGKTITISAVVTNTGNYTLPEGLSVRFYLNSNSSAAGTASLPHDLAVGESATVKAKVTLPSYIGTYNVYSVVNEERLVKELSYANNSSKLITVNTVSPFSVSVNVDQAVYKQGEKVLVSGQLTGSRTADTDIDIYIINDGVRQMKTVTTGADGTFIYEWQLQDYHAGHFAVGACYPGEGTDTEMAAFDVYGLQRIKSGFITCETKLGEPYEGIIEVRNPGTLPQTITSFEVISKPEACDVVLSAPSAIAENGTARLKYTLTCNAVTKINDWETIVVKLTTEEGATLTTTLYCFCTPHHAVLTTNTTNIKTTITKGTTREYLLNVMNTGKASTGKIRVQLPNTNWIKLGTPAEMPALEYGEEATICLRFTASDDMSLNLPYTGQLALNCENGNGVAISYNIEVVSEATGVLEVDVVDEYTYYTEEKPHVAGADVVVKHPVTGALVAQGKTNANGVYSVELPEGYYTISVTEEHHKSVAGNVLVDPGVKNKQEVFLSYTAVTYSWDVVETEVEDEYKIETIAKFETNVPKPVVVINLPSERPDDGSIIAIPVTNKGLINAQNVVLNLDCTDGYTLELLNQESLEILPPQQTHIFYAKFTKNVSRSNSAADRNKAWGNPDVDCVSILAASYYDYICGYAITMEEALAQNKWGECMKEIEVDYNPPTIKPFDPIVGPSWPGGPGGGYRIPTGPSPTPHIETPKLLENLRQWYCNLPCGRELTQALACEAADKIIPDWLSCPYDLLNQVLYGNWEGQMSAILGCADLPDPFSEGCWDNYIECMLKHFNILSASASNRQRASYDRGYETALNFSESDKLVKKVGFAYRRITEELLGDAEWLGSEAVELSELLDYIDSMGDNHIFTSSELMPYKPQDISISQLEVYVERVNNTKRYKNSGYKDVANYINPDTLNYYSNVIEQCEETARNAGWENLGEMYKAAYDELKEYVSDDSNSVCASVSIKISQTMVMTRQAFRGTLTVFNGSEEAAMQDVRLKLDIINVRTGEIATSHEFQTNAESLNGFAGDLEIGSAWTLDANETGTATMLFIPTKYAAPEEATEWSFGGTLSYIDPFTGLEVTRDLSPVKLTVKPSPVLNLTYFMQRDIKGDDPLTEEIEPCEEAEFSLLIHNTGYGDATNVRMVTNQPEIIENEKGLFIDFELMSSQLNGEEKTLALGGSVATDFGTIPSKGTSYAQWWIKSSLLGHFTDYEVEATHITSYDNPDLTLLNDVTIHELIRSIEIVDGDKTIVGFMTNDIADAKDTPDMLYLSNGEKETVGKADATITKISDTEYRLTVTPSSTGWVYGNISDPTYGVSAINSIVRQSDNKEISLRNIWQTDRTLRDGKEPLYENMLHFADKFESLAPETYILTFNPTPKTQLEVIAIEGLPAEGDIAKKHVETINVVFNKQIDPQTFTSEDLSLAVQGVSQDASLMKITTDDDKRFKLDLSAYNGITGNGYYVLQVQTAGITDKEGFNGKTGKSAGWIMYRDGYTSLTTSVYPEQAGYISLAAKEGTEAGTQGNKTVNLAYGETYILTATANEGYNFLNWSIDGVVVSEQPQIEHIALNDVKIVANFAFNTYSIEVEPDLDGGSIIGTSTGVYNYGTELSFTAIPDKDYAFEYWCVNGEEAGSQPTLTITVDKPYTVSAVFKKEYYNQKITFAKGWNWISSYLSEPISVAELANNSVRIIGQYDEIAKDQNNGFTGNFNMLENNSSYKVLASSAFIINPRGHLNDNSLTLKGGWNWIAYPYYESKSLSATVANAENGDLLISQKGFAEYADGNWEGTLTELVPGCGYIYKSVSDKTLQLKLDGQTTTDNEPAKTPSLNLGRVSYEYPNTMNIIARLYQNEQLVNDGTYEVYALVGDSYRGYGEKAGENYYITVYGDESVEISFIVLDSYTGTTYKVENTITFTNDVIGSRISPLKLTFDDTPSGIEAIFNQNDKFKVYSVEGILISNNASIDELHKLPRGIYIVNGSKYIVK